jgi:hypothetical protein
MDTKIVKIWKRLAIFFPLMWLVYLYLYIKQDGCFFAGAKVACGWQGLLMLVGWFIFCFIWPLKYIFIILPQIKKEETEKILNIFNEESKK